MLLSCWEKVRHIFQNSKSRWQGEVAYKMEKAPYYAARILNFPSSTQITREEIEYVAEQIKEVLGGFGVD